MQLWLTKALWRAGTKLSLGLAIVAALVGIRIVTATPVGVEGDLAELARLGAELETEGADDERPAESSANPAWAPAPMASAGPEARPAPASADPGDLDRLVRCHGGQGVQFMRAADCATRGGRLEELPPPEPDEAASSPGR